MDQKYNKDSNLSLDKDRKTLDHDNKNHHNSVNQTSQKNSNNPDDKRDQLSHISHTQPEQTKKEIFPSNNGHGNNKNPSQQQEYPGVQNPKANPIVKK